MSYGLDYSGKGGGGYGGGGYTGGNSGNGFGGGEGFGASSGGGGGGGGGTPASPAATARKSYDQQTLLPVTVSMILNAQPIEGEAGTATLQLKDGRPINQVCFVASPRDIEDLSTNVVYHMYDGTGIIEVKKWIDDNDCTAVTALRNECANKGTYMKIIGQVRDYNGRKMVVADHIRPLQSGNELAHHMLQVVYSAQKYKQQSSYVSGSNWNKSGPGNSQTPLQSANNGSGDKLRDLVLDLVLKEPAPEGVSVVACCLRLGNRYNQEDVRNAMYSLSAEGVLYSTIDENHYKVVT